MIFLMVQLHNLFLFFVILDVYQMDLQCITPLAGRLWRSLQRTEVVCY